MRSRYLLALAALLVATLLSLNYLWKHRPEPDEMDPFTRMLAGARMTGFAAPDFSAVTLDGDSFVLADHVGRQMIVLNFFTTWCGPCREEMPELAEYYRRHAGDTFLLVGIDVDEKADLVRAFVREQALPFPVIVDRGRGISGKYGVRSFPTTVVVNADGRVGLYEVGSIANAEVVFTPLLALNQSLRENGLAVTVEQYRARLAGETGAPRPLEFTAATDDDRETPLAGRAAKLAAAMDCPCGCQRHTAADCPCRIGKALREKLRREPPDDRTETAVLIRRLNAEFCGWEAPDGSPPGDEDEE